ncbi:hypothetical protein GQ53DRAFT_734258 [Thozetella sp. PMI_491]|nr:hypothetical protein GQ53DRAFT_734258 [Thozetella sp. PMI_491]
MADAPSAAGLEPVCQILTPVGMMGYGLDGDMSRMYLAKLVSTGIPTAIILDAGSTDSGPAKLALGHLTVPRSSYVRDLTKLLKLVDEFHVPLIFSSAGGDGTDEHVREMIEVIGEISSRPENRHYKLKTLAIFSGIKKDFVRERLSSGAISGCGRPVPPLKEDDIDAVTRIVGQMGPEPYIDAMNAHPDFDIIVGGRSYDPAPYVAYAAFKAQAAHPSSPKASEREVAQARRIFGGFTHMGKIMECGGACATPKSHGAVATIYSDGTFDIGPMKPEARCTPISVAAHTLYEKTRPDLLHGPGGHLDLTKATYEQLSDDTTVRVRGGTFHFSREQGLPYQLKLEAAGIKGYGAMAMGSIHSPIMIRQLDGILKRIRGYVAQQHSDVSEKWDLGFHVHGKHDTVTDDDHEVFIIAESRAETQESASSIISAARVALMHGDYPGQKATSGNFAFGIGVKMQFDLGPCPEFRIYHLMDLKEGEELLLSDEKGLFPLDVSVVGKGETKTDGVDTSDPLPPKNGTSAPTGKTVDREATKQAESSSAEPPSTLNDISRVLRSKNAGPYEITFDVMFTDEAVYNVVKEADFLTTKKAAEVLGVSEDEVIWCGYFGPALAWKVTIPRKRGGLWAASGAFLENDVHGSQQYMPLARMKLPEDLVQKLAAVSS